MYFGAEGLVTGSSSVAFKLKITPLDIGLTVVSFGTSSPELIISITAALRGNGGIAVGNIIGSNICNIALILGVSAILNPIKVNIKLIRIDILIMIFTSLIVILFLLDGKLQRYEGILLTLGIISYILLTLILARKERNELIEQEFVDLIPKRRVKIFYDFILILGGLIILVIGANLFIQGAVKVARLIGASEGLIGLSIVALGTSLPEFATSAVASLKKEGDISIGNLVGSNIFNIFFILGISSLLVPVTAIGISMIDLYVMLFVAIITLPIARTGYIITRLEGLFLLLIYIGYIYYLYLQLP